MSIGIGRSRWFSRIPTKAIVVVAPKVVALVAVVAVAPYGGTWVGLGQAYLAATTATT